MCKVAAEYRDLFRGAARGGVAAGILIWVLALASEDPRAASVYRCTDQSSTSVFTDSPVQLEGCKAVEARLGALSEKSSQSVSPAPPRRTAPPAASQTNLAAGSRPEAESWQVTVPIQRVGHLLIVPTQINETLQARLILVTGASHTILSSAISRELGLRSHARAASVTLKTAGGPVQAEVVRVDSIQVAEAEVRNSLVAVYDVPDMPPGVDGLLGLTFLNRFQVTLDTARGELHLRQPDQ